jgi:cytosine/adenosine deaminase-related metal-dependent hydrolase
MGNPLKIFTAKYLVAGDGSSRDSGALLVEQGRVRALGALAAIKGSAPDAELYDCGDAVLLPLFVNAHTHLELSHFDDWARASNTRFDGEDFVGWMLKLIAVKRALEPRQLAASLEHGINLALRSGTGVVGDILSYPELHSHYRDSAMGGVCFLETLGQNPEMIAKVKENLEKVVAEFDADLMSAGLSPHSPYTMSADYMADVYRWCRKAGLRASTHLAESRDELDFIREGRGALTDRLYPYVGWEDYLPQGTGLSPVEYLQRQGGLFPENLLVHGVHVTNSDIALLAEKGMHLALCPRSNATLDVGRAPAGALLKAGVGLALGTDSLASNTSLSLWDEMAFAHDWFGGELDALTLLHMATLGGARALGLEADYGSLTPGKRADFQVVKLPQGVAKSELFDYFVAPDCDKEIEQVYHRGEAMLPPVGN